MQKHKKEIKVVYCEVYVTTASKVSTFLLLFLYTLDETLATQKNLKQLLL